MRKMRDELIPRNKMEQKIINGIKILHFSELESTNKTAMEIKDAEHLDTVIADSQTGGRGRLGRSFFSPDSGLYITIVLEPCKIVCGLSMCTAAAAVAVRETLEDEGISGLQIKWVNDILKDGRKVCGILTEARSDGGGIFRVAVGIGINLREPQGGFPEDIKNRAGAVGFFGDKLALAAKIAARLGGIVEKAPETVAEKYRSQLAFVGNTVTVTDYADGAKKLRVKILGVDENCFLKVETENGEIRTLSSGEIGS